MLSRKLQKGAAPPSAVHAPIRSAPTASLNSLSNNFKLFNFFSILTTHSLFKLR